MIIGLGVLLMIFKKTFLLVSLLALTHCALKFGEIAPLNPVYSLDPASKTCENLNYRQVFSDYFFSPNSLNGDKLATAFHCLSANIQEAVYSINNEYLTKEDVSSLVDQKVVDFGNFNSTLNFIMYSEYSDSFLSIKNNLFQILKKDFDRESFHSNFTCSFGKTNGRLISKTEALDLSAFLESTAQWFTDIEESASDIQQSFFVKHKVRPEGILSNKKFLLWFQSFLYFKVKDDFPEYADFLKSQSGSIESIQPVVEMLALPDKDSEGQSSNVSVLNVKYMLLNIYLTQAFFRVYDRNQDSILSHQELEPIVCMVSPIVELIMTRWFNEINKESSLLKTLSLAEELNIKELSGSFIHYVISQQKAQINGMGLIDFLLYHQHNKNQETLSYSLDHADMTRLISLLFHFSVQSLGSSNSQDNPK